MLPKVCTLAWGWSSMEKGKTSSFVKPSFGLHTLSAASEGGCVHFFRGGKECEHFAEERVESSRHPGLFSQPLKLHHAL